MNGCAGACRAHGKVLGVGGIRHNVALQGELIRLGARFVIAGTDVNYVLAGARQDTTALRADPAWLTSSRPIFSAPRSSRSPMVPCCCGALRERRPQHWSRRSERSRPLAPFRNMTTPGGFRMSVAMTNCGEAGWVTDRTGYRYQAR